jgi:trimeric autotransporter adhesin
MISTVAGSTGKSKRGGGFSGDGGLATSSLMSDPTAVTVDASGNIYIADTTNSVIRMVAKSTRIISTVAGNGQIGFSGDGGQATEAQLRSPRGVAVDAYGDMYILANDRIRKVKKSTGIITTVAGTRGGFSGDGGQAISAAKSAGIARLQGIAIDASGNIYIADAGTYRIRVVTKSTGIITTVAGNGQNGFSGDGGYATSAAIGVCQGIAVDALGNIYIADTYNNRIRVVTKSTSIITTVAGNGEYGDAGDGGQATSAEVRSPRGVAVDASGNIYISDIMSNTIRMVAKSTGIISTVAGDGQIGFRGDKGFASYAQLSSPRGVAVDAYGDIYIADTGNNRIRKISYVKPAAATTK